MRFGDVYRLFMQFGRTGLLLVIPIIAVTIVLYYIWYKKRKKEEKRFGLIQIVFNGILVLYIFIVLSATLLFRSSGFHREMHLIPFSIYLQAWYFASASEWRNLVLNILMFIPIGFLLPVTFTRFRFLWKVVLFGFVFSACIEVAQFITGRGITAFDDLMNNTVGALIGYCLYSLTVALLNRQLTIRRFLLWVTPILAVILSFLCVYVVYQTMEFGLLPYNPHATQDMSSITIEDYSTHTDVGEVSRIYRVSTQASRAEMQDFAFTLASKFCNDFELNWSEDYDSSSWYRFHSSMRDEEFQIVINSSGLAYRFMRMGTWDARRQSGMYEADVLKLLYAQGITIPDSVYFEEVSPGEYRFEMKEQHSLHHNSLDGDSEVMIGALTVTIVYDDMISDINNQIVMLSPVRDVAIISIEEALQLLNHGKFINWGPMFDSTSTVQIVDVSLSTMRDSKGFFQPVYQFTILMDGSDGVWIVPALIR